MMDKMQPTIIIIVILIIIILLIYFYAQRANSPQVRKIRQRKQIAQLDDPEVRKTYTDELDERIRKLNNLDADELFTRATLYLREQDDLQDQLFSRGSVMSKKMHYMVTRRLAYATRMAQETIRLAIAKRNVENAAAANFIFHDDAIEERANEIDRQAREIAPIIHHIAPEMVPPAARAPHIAHVHAAAAPHTIAQHWAPDPENVHDSAVGERVAHHLRHLQQHDEHLIHPSTCIGTILLIMNDRLPAGQGNNDEKREKIKRTLQRAFPNDHCSRYNIGEIEALRLVLENTYHAKTEEQIANLQDALLDSLVESAPGNSGTVCSVGRISRYVASLDGVDEAIGGDNIKTVDAYRAEILNSIGQVSATGADDTKLRQEINKICDTYKGQLPDNNLQKIREECLAAVTD